MKHLPPRVIVAGTEVFHMVLKVLKVYYIFCYRPRHSMCSCEELYKHSENLSIVSYNKILFTPDLQFSKLFSIGLRGKLSRKFATIDCAISGIKK